MVNINENLYKEIEKSTLILLNDTQSDKKSELPFILKEVLKANGITIFIYDKIEKNMRIFLKSYSDEIIPNDFKFHLSIEDEEKCITAYKNNKCMETDYNGTHIQNYIRSYFIQFENELIGILNVYYDNKSLYSDVQEDIIRSTCDRIGIVIKNRLLTNEYKLELQKRKESEKKLQIFLESSIDFYIICDSEHIYFENESSTKKLEEFFECDIEEAKRRINNKGLRHPDDEKRVSNIYKVAKKYGKVDGVVIRYLCNNKYKSIEWNFRFNKEENRFYLAGKDITISVELEREKRELEKTVEMESLKTDFFANMSHEFKTPLNIILTAEQVLTEKFNKCDNCNKLDDNINRYLKGIKQNSYRLLKIVNNIMDINKIDSGSYNLELGNYNIVSVVEDIVMSVVGYLNENKRNIIFDTMEEEIILACDPIKIERIILNLLSNALKYTYENGNIEVFVDIDKIKNEAVISVKNDGDKISEDEKDRIFERFTQSENLLTRKAEGTGIGLFLVKLLVEMHGRRIYVDTSEEKGAKFVFTLPINTVEEKKESRAYEKQIISKVETCNIEFSDIYSI